LKKALCVIFCFLFLFLSLSLSSCNNKSPGVTAIASGLSFSAQINDNGLCYTLYVEIDEKNNTENEIISDSSLKGMKIIFNESDTVINYKELEIAPEWLPQNMHLDFIHSVFYDIKQKQQNPELKNGEYVIEGKTEKYDYRLLLGGSGLPIKIEDKSNSISVVIKDAKIKKGAE